MTVLVVGRRLSTASQATGDTTRRTLDRPRPNNACKPFPTHPPHQTFGVCCTQPDPLATQMPPAVHFYSNTLRRVLSVSKTCREWPLSPSALTLELEVFNQFESGACQRRSFLTILLVPPKSSPKKYYKKKKLCPFNI